MARDFTSVIKGPNGEYSVGVVSPSEAVLSLSGFTLTLEEAESVERTVHGALNAFQKKVDEWREEMSNAVRKQISP